MLELGPVPLSWSGVALGSTVLLLLSARSWRRTRAIDRHRRGTRVLNAGRRRRLRDSTTRAAVSLGGVQILPLEESKHFKLIGTTGTGKSTAIGELLQAALRRGDRAVVADPEGAYRVRLHRRYRGDVLLNPFESGSLMGSVRRAARGLRR